MSQPNGAISVKQEEVSRTSSTVGSLVILAQLATPTLKKAQHSEFFVVFYNWSPCSLNRNINGSLAVFTQPVTAPREKAQ
jgi:hypothetical protein